MNPRDPFAALADLMANPFIPELHNDDCPDPDCPGCTLTDTHNATTDGAAMNPNNQHADAGACGTCRKAADAGGPVTHDECAARATLFRAPDQPGYEDLVDLTEAERQALPARFHTPQFDALGKPKAWLCAVCWGDGWSTQWPCKTAQENGAQVFTDQTRTEYRAEVLAERDAQVVAWLGKKAAEYGSSNREARTKAAAVALMADKLSRGAVRDDETGLTELYRLRSENNQMRTRIAELEARETAITAYATSRVTGPDATNEASASWVLHLLGVDPDESTTPTDGPR